MKTVGFIGFGNMAQAIITGLISSGNFKCEEIGAYDTDADKLKCGAKELGITAFSSNRELVESSECIVIAVKPNALQNVLTPLNEALRESNPLIISIAAGQTIEKLRSLIGFDAHIVRVMPNINAIAGQAISGYAASSNVNEQQLLTAVKILDSFGASVKVEEEKFSAYSAIAGCSPAYAYVFIDAIARVGVKYGLSKKDALSIVTSAVTDTLKNYRKSEGDLLFEQVVLNAIESAYNKDKGIG